MQVRLRVDPAFCGRRGIVIARENLSRVVAPKKNPVRTRLTRDLKRCQWTVAVLTSSTHTRARACTQGKQHAANISLFKHTTPFSIYESLAEVEKDEVADITYRQFREEWKRRRDSESGASASAAGGTHTLLCSARA
jgi:hypothetical protein